MLKIKVEMLAVLAGTFPAIGLKVCQNLGMDIPAIPMLVIH